MPTITFSLKDLQNLVGKKISIEELRVLCHSGKGEFEGYDEETDEAKVNFDDTNLPYLWSVEGFARLLRQVLDKQKGITKFEIHKDSYELIVDDSVKKIRPCIEAFVAKGKKIDDYLLKQIIQLQEKLCESYGRKRLNIAIGVYSYKKLKFPIYYKATEPESIEFVPLDYRKKMTQQEILEEHPKGKEYAWILKGAMKYPILVDSNNEVLSFPPIINSAITGKIEPGEEDIFFEVTGISQDTINLAANIFAQAFYERGFKIYSVDIKYKEKTITTPYDFNEIIKIDKKRIKELLGLELADTEIKALVEKAGYGFENFTVKIPSYRKDILYQDDVIEDIGIVYGFDKIGELPLTSYSIGETTGIQKFIDKCREIFVGLSCQEVMSPVLSNKGILCKKMNLDDFGTIEIEQYSSEHYSVVRSWLIPILMDFLSKNQHVDYPQKIFEQGVVAVRKGDDVREYERIAVLICGTDEDYTKIRQFLDYFSSLINLKFDIEDVEHGSFIAGRVGRVLVGQKKVGFIGEIHPVVLDAFGLAMPVSAMEINLTELYSIIHKKLKQST